MSIAQGNAWARPGETVTCTGCHMGHVSGTVAEQDAEAAAGWTNVAPYATVSASNYFDHNNPDAPNYQPFRPHLLNDRRGWIPVPAGGPKAPFMQEEARFLNYRGLLARVGLGTQVGLEAVGLGAVGLGAAKAADHLRATAPQGTVPQPEQPGAAVHYQNDASSWLTEQGRAVGEWVTLDWETPMRVKSIRLVGVPPTGGDWEGFGIPSEAGPYYIEQGSLRFYRNGAQQGVTVAVGRIEPLATGGTLITLDQPLEIDHLHFTINEISGRWWSEEVAALSEIEVMGMAAAAMPLPTIELTEVIYLPAVAR